MNNRSLLASFLFFIVIIARSQSAFTIFAFANSELPNSIENNVLDAYSDEHDLQVTISKRLALYITKYDPSDSRKINLTEAIKNDHKYFPFVKTLPEKWSRTVVLESEAGNFITCARSFEKANTWYVARVNDNTARISSIKFDFLEKNKKYIATIYSDEISSHYKTNPKVYQKRMFRVSRSSSFTQLCAPGGGYLISIREASPNGRYDKLPKLK